MASGGPSAPPAAPLAASAAHMATKVELTISCENLLDMDVFSKSDPLCALYINPSGTHWYEVCNRSWCTVLSLYILCHLINKLQFLCDSVWAH